MLASSTRSRNVTESSAQLEFPAAYRGVLCHPDGKKSCGACCGMYNEAAEEPAILEKLDDRRREFEARECVGSSTKLTRFALDFELPKTRKILEDLPVCPMLGSLSDSGLVGCMVHPTQNDLGCDGRDFGVYDKTTCEDYLCASHQLLRRHEKWLVIAAVDSSYLYGLVITDVRFVRELLAQSAAVNGAEPSPASLSSPEAIDAALAYFRMKTQWPYRDPTDGIFGQTKACGGLETQRRAPPCVDLGVESQPEDSILTCLGTKVGSVSDLNDARSLVRKRIDDFASAVAQDVCGG